MRHKQRDESDYRASGSRRHGVPQHAEPGADLPSFFPPVVADNEVGDCADRPQDEDHKRAQQNQGSHIPGTRWIDLTDAVSRFQTHGWRDPFATTLLALAAIGNRTA